MVIGPAVRAGYLTRTLLPICITTGLIAVMIQLMSLSSCSPTQFYNTSKLGLFPVCQNVSSPCNEKYFYEESEASTTSDRICLSFKKEEDELCEKMQENIGTAYEFLNSLSVKLQNFLKRTKVQKCFQDAIEKHSKVFFTIQSENQMRKVMEWMQEKSKYEDMFTDCDKCQVFFLSINQKLQNWYEKQVQSIESELFGPYTSRALAKFKDRVAFLKSSSKKYYEEVKMKIGDKIQIVLKTIANIDIMNSQTKMNSESRKLFFKKIFDNLEFIVHLEKIMDINYQTSTEIDKMAIKMEDLTKDAFKLLNKEPSNRNDATAFQAMYLNLESISDCCSETLSQHFDAFCEMKSANSLRKKLDEKVGLAIDRAIFSKHSMPLVAAILVDLQLYDSFMPNHILKMSERIENFLYQIDVSQSASLHNELKKLGGLGEELISSQPYFQIIQARIRSSRAKQGLNDILKGLKGSDVNKGFFWSSNPLEIGYQEYEVIFDDMMLQLGASKDGVYDLKDVNQIETLEQMIIGKLMEHLDGKCKIANQPGDFNKKCVPKTIGYLASLWSLSTAKVQKSGPVYLFQPYVAQIITILRLLDTETNQLRSHLAQVGTGEGKSLDLAFVAAFLALVGADVHIVCYSPYLTSRDSEEYQNFYTKLNVRHRIHYQTIDQLTQHVINTYADPKSFVGSKFQKSFTSLPSVANSYLLIDEVDVFFNARFFGDTFNIGSHVTAPAIKDLTMQIWQERPSLKDILSSEIYDKVKYELANFPSILLEHAVKKMLHDATHFGNHTYHFQNGKVGYSDLDHINTEQFHVYKTLFAYIIEDLKSPIQSNLENVFALQLACGSISYAEIPLFFKSIIGVTATFESLNQVEKDILKTKYHIEKYSIIPTMFALSATRIAHPIIISNDDEFNVNLLSLIETSLQHGKGSVIVVFDNSVGLLNFYESDTFKPKQLQTKFFTEQSDESERHAMPRRTNADQITLITKAYGRGVDFSCYDTTVNNNGGVVIIQTFLSKEPSEIVQIKGRTGRQGHAGTYRIIVKKQEEVMGKFGWSESDVEKCVQNCDHLLFEQISAKYSESCKDKSLMVENKQNIHLQTIEFLKDIQNKKIENVKRFLIANNNYAHVDISKFSNKPLHTLFCLDSSGSMGFDNHNPWNQLVEAVKYFLQQRIRSNRVQDVISFVIYDHIVERVLIQLPIENALKEIDNILVLYGGATEFGAAIGTSQKILEQTDLDKYDMKFMFLSDGESVSGGAEMTLLGHSLGPKNLKTSIFAFGQNANHDKLKGMVVLHGFNAEFLETSDIGRQNNQEKNQLESGVQEQMDRFLSF